MFVYYFSPSHSSTLSHTSAKARIQQFEMISEQEALTSNNNPKRKSRPSYVCKKTTRKSARTPGKPTRKSKRLSKTKLNNKVSRFEKQWSEKKN